MPVTIGAVIFDMDGLLLDTERIARRTFLEACAELGHAVDGAVCNRCIGTTEVTTGRILKESLGEAIPFEAFRAVWDRRYHGEVLEAPVPLKAGAEGLLRRLSASGIPMAVATSTKRAVAMTKLGNAAILDRFAHVVAGDEVSEGKPHPEIYATAATRLGVAADFCLALEDSDNGVRAAHAAGMRVIQVPDLVAPSSDVRALGHEVLASLAEVERHLLGASPAS